MTYMFMSLKISLDKYFSQVPVINKVFSRLFKVLFSGRRCHIPYTLESTA